MERHRLGKAALAALAAWSLAARAQAPQEACVPGTAASPGTMTEMGFPCPEGSGPGIAEGRLSELPTTAETGGAVGPYWNRPIMGAAGVPASSRINEDEASATSQPAPTEGTEASGR